MHASSFLTHGEFRYLKVALGLVAAAILAYAVHDPMGGPAGDTWLGYTLGGLGAALILSLLWYGVRKRRFRSNTGTVRGWLSAHVYFGAALVVITTLHCAFQFGWNVHTIAYTLMLLVVTSGIYGVYAYRRYPDLMTENRTGIGPQAMLDEVASIEQQAVELADRIDDATHQVVLRSIRNNRIGGGVLTQLRGERPRSKRKSSAPRSSWRKERDAGRGSREDQGAGGGSHHARGVHDALRRRPARRGRAGTAGAAHPPADGPALAPPRAGAPAQPGHPAPRPAADLALRARPAGRRPARRPGRPHLRRVHVLVGGRCRSSFATSRASPSPPSAIPTTRSRRTRSRSAAAAMPTSSCRTCTSPCTTRCCVTCRRVASRSRPGPPAASRWTAAPVATGNLRAGDTLGVGLSTLRLQRADGTHDLVLDVEETQAQPGQAAEAGATSLQEAGLGRRRWAWAALVVVILLLGVGVPLGRM
ncbi:MAG: hypothetical protein U5K43_11000 [Halofilum sp. (in: g-proteobacteria)]|nr:hypothetical protein [Halofilum sp. (in: g-proteobacteria)]